MLDRVSVDRVEQFVCQCFRVEPAGGLRDIGAGLVVDFAVERGEPCRQGRGRVVIAPARGDIVDEAVEADLPLAVQGLRNVLQALGHADRIDQHEAGFLLGIRRHLAQLRRRDRARAAAFHLLEIERRLHIAQKD